MQWMTLQRTADQHSANATAALQAFDLQDKLVNRHLHEIARRELDLAKFTLIVAESPAFKLDGEE